MSDLRHTDVLPLGRRELYGSQFLNDVVPAQVTDGELNLLSDQTSSAIRMDSAPALSLLANFAEGHAGEFDADNENTAAFRATLGIAKAAHRRRSDPLARALRNNPEVFAGCMARLEDPAASSAELGGARDLVIDAIRAHDRKQLPAIIRAAQWGYAQALNESADKSAVAVRHAIANVAVWASRQLAPGVTR
jgi:hypothetical protein